MHGEQLLYQKYHDDSVPTEDLAPTLHRQSAAESLGGDVTLLQAPGLLSSTSGAFARQRDASMLGGTSSEFKQTSAPDALLFASKADVKLPKMVPAERQQEYISAFGSHTKLPRTPLLPGY